jgi:integrase
MPLKLIPPRTGKSPNWTIRGTHLRIRVDQTTGTSDERLARKQLAKVRDEIERGAFSRPGAPTFASAALNYIDTGGEPRFVLKLAEHFGEAPLSRIDQAAIDAAAVTLYPRASQATRNRQVYSPISAILKRAGVEDKIRRPKGAGGVSRMFFFQPVQASAIISGARSVDPEFGLFLAFLLYTGCRLSDALSLEIAALDLVAATAFFPRTKNGLPRLAYLPPVLVSAMAEHPRGYDDRVGRVFRFRKNGRLYTLLAQAERRAGVTIPAGVAFHAFRHTWGAWMKRGGADLVATGAWLSEEAAAIYEHLDVSEEARKADRLPNVWKARGKATK